MSALSDFPITRRWPAQHPDRIQLYSLNTPNGVKASIMLEETGLAYEAHRVDIMENESHLPEFLALNSNGKIPAIIDPDGPGGEALGMFESGAILLYLAEKSGKFLSNDPAQRWRTIQWVFFQMASIGPMFGQLGFFHKFGGKDFDDKRPLQRYIDESKRLLGVLDKQLDGNEWIVGDEYSVADIATIGWVDCLVNFYGAGELVDFESHTNVVAWFKRGMDRPAVQRGLKIPSRD
ncbi:MAG: glutathione binding-like protein [Dokdonella sp.]